MCVSETPVAGFQCEHVPFKVFLSSRHILRVQTDIGRCRTVLTPAGARVTRLFAVFQPHYHPKGTYNEQPLHLPPHLKHLQLFLFSWRHQKPEFLTSRFFQPLPTVANSYDTDFESLFYILPPSTTNKHLGDPRAERLRGSDREPKQTK